MIARLSGNSCPGRGATCWQKRPGRWIGQRLVALIWSEGEKDKTNPPAAGSLSFIIFRGRPEDRPPLCNRPLVAHRHRHHAQRIASSSARRLRLWLEAVSVREMKPQVNQSPARSNLGPPPWRLAGRAAGRLSGGGRSARPVGRQSKSDHFRLPAGDLLHLPLVSGATSGRLGKQVAV